MTKKQRIATTVLWSCAAVFMLVGGIMLALGVRPLIGYFGELVNIMGGGDMPEFPTMSELALAIVGLVFFLVGAVLLYITGILSKRFRRGARDEEMGDRLRASVDRYMSSRGKSKEEPAPAANGFCARCGHAVEKPEHRYCPYCGTMLVPLSALQTAESAEPQEPEMAVVDEGGDLYEQAPAYEAPKPAAPEPKKATASINLGPKGAVTCKYCGSTYHMGEEVCLLCGRKLEQ